jgi:1,4-dihydroxy-2-naphthoyl-CoA synthase
VDKAVVEVARVARVATAGVAAEVKGWGEGEGGCLGMAAILAVAAVTAEITGRVKLGAVPVTWARPAEGTLLVVLRAD